ncbi:MAG: bile acid:sodium symporter family protein [Planctomycetota bacterium]
MPAKVLVLLGTAALVAAVVLGLLAQRSVAGAAGALGMTLLAVAASASRRFKSLAFTIWVLAFVICAISYPWFFISWGGFELKRTIPPLVQLILFGMGMTLTFEDFARVFKMPRGVFIGFTLQYTVMPLMGLTFATLFGLKPEVAAGLILIGSCPGGVSSNVITYIAGANVALSVTMTACSTLLSPLITPFAMKLFAGQYVPIDVWAMMKTILWLIIVPLVAGVLINRYAHKLARRLVRVLPFLAMLSICIIIAITIAVSRGDLIVMGFALFGASLCHNAAGFTLGYWGARMSGLDKRDSRTVAIEVGMQNGGMATSLAFNVLDSARAAMTSAVFGPWSAVAGSALASYWRRGTEGARTTAAQTATEQP